MANIPAESYLKASDAPDLQKPDKALQSPPPASTDPATMLSGNAGEGATACGGSAAAGQDLISVPRNTFMTLLQTNLDNKPPRQTPLPYAAPLPPFSHQAERSPRPAATLPPQEVTTPGPRAGTRVPSWRWTLTPTTPTHTPLRPTLACRASLAPLHPCLLTTDPTCGQTTSPLPRDPTSGKETPRRMKKAGDYSRGRTPPSTART